MLSIDVAPGIHRIEDAYTNWYLIEDGGRLTIVDAGVPTSWQSLQDALSRIGRRRDDVEALVLTHGHFDHLGFAERARRELGVPVYVHENDVPLTRHPWRYDHERPRRRYLATQVGALPIVASLTRNRAWFPPPVAEVRRYEGGTLPVPGRPQVLFTPGHTLASIAYVVGDAAFIHDTIFMPDGGTARTDFPGGSARALWRSIQRIMALPDDTRLFTGHDYCPGHRKPQWESTVAEQRAKNTHLTKAKTGRSSWRCARSATVNCRCRSSSSTRWR